MSEQSPSEQFPTYSRDKISDSEFIKANPDFEGFKQLIHITLPINGQETPLTAFGHAKIKDLTGGKAARVH